MFFCITNGKRWLSLAAALSIFVLSICVYAHADSQKDSDCGISVPILMYHSVLKDKSRAGKYIVSTETLENDLKYLSEHQYHTVFVSDLIQYVYHKTPLPENPVILTFDDGHYNNMVYLLPLLEQYDMKAVISVVGSYTETFSKHDGHNPNYSYLTWEDISVLQKTGRIEIANHTYNMHDSTSRKGCSIKKGESREAYQSVFFQDVTKLQSALSKQSQISPPVTFAYPFGYICPESQKVLEEAGFFASLSCYEKVSKISDEKSSLYCLGRFNRPDGISTEEFMKKIQLP